MALPPFPCQDLAKLVLGYLDEEDLMTVYDEFLHESPYLDASSNEFDRVILTSLKSMLAEFRAVKIFLSSCKPNVLRRRLKSCPNLVEAFKLLVELADVTKLSPDSRLQTSYEDHSQKQSQPANETCERVWPFRSQQSLPFRNEHMPDNPMEISVEAASPYHLPGNFGTTKKKRIRTLERQRDVYRDRSVDQTSHSYNLMHYNTPTNIHNEGNVRVAEPNTALSNETNSPHLQYSSNEASHGGKYLHHRSNEQSITNGSNVPTCNVYTERLHETTTARDSCKAVAGDNLNTIVPDVNTPKNTNVAPTSTENTTSSTGTFKEITNAHSHFKYGTISSKNQSPYTYPGKIKPKTDQKIMILSDIKVDKQLVETSGMPEVSTSGPMPEVLRKSAPLMQTILINGTPAFRQCENLNYTKDEIMAMPTFIVVANSSAETTAAPTLHTTVPLTNTIVTSATQLGTLLADIANDTGKQHKEDTKSDSGLNNNNTDNATLLKTVQGKNFSLPKDNIITTDSTSKSTPQVVPPVRKSSSTPRRNSHIRVLDFATPRRILQDAIDEHAEIGDSQNTKEVIVSRSPSLHTFVEAASNDKTNSEIQEPQNASVGSSKDNEDTKKNNWDAKLRALAVANNDGFIKTVPICHQRKRKPPIKKVHKSDKKKTAKSKKIKSNEVIVVTSSPSKDEADAAVSVKPTINIVTASDWVIPDTKQPQSDQNKSNEEPTQTPEFDKTSLQNVMGSKLNISDLLETPYKQALYDIQMETPRFLDFPGEPLSDIKITNIPTPRFMDTPKPQATPSYSSRATDYSSGGSYYKPDDQDSLALNQLGYLIKVSENNKKSEEQLDDAESKSGVRSRRSSTRPIRNCAKNVTYRSSPLVKKSKDKKSAHVAEDKNDTLSSCSDTNYSSFDLERRHENKITQSSKRQSDTSSRSKTRKSPAKKQTPKSFMKIRPRQSNPSKASARKTKRKTPESSKRTNSKGKSGTILAIVSTSTKSRRKSSTPRKIEGTNADNYPTDSPDHSETDNNPFGQRIDKPVRYPEVQDDSCEIKSKNISTNDSDDINKIKEFIAISESTETRVVERSLQADLVNRGFDEATARIIERDLLDTPNHPSTIASDTVNIDLSREETKKVETQLEKTLESSATSNHLQIVQDNEDDDDDTEPLDWSVHECNEQTKNFTSYSYNESQQIAKESSITIKDDYTMQVLFENEEVNLKLMQLTSFIDMRPTDENPTNLEYIDYSYNETELAVSSISNIHKLYTPLKDPNKAVCKEIFDSTLTSLDTPLKATSPKIIEHEMSVTEIVLEVETIEERGKQTKRKRRRISSGDSDETKEGDIKKTKRQTSVSSEGCEESKEGDIKKTKPERKVTKEGYDETKEGDTKKTKREISVSREETNEEDTNKTKRGTSVNSDDISNDNKTKPETPYLLNTENFQKIDIESVLCRLHGP